jgi:DNA-binding transcriptional regulator/RsmH inhibitor MraZ
MRFFTGSKIDAQGRIAISGLIDPLTEVVCYVTEENFDLLFVLPYSDDIDIPSNYTHKLDDKGRFIIPSAFRKNAVFGYITTDISETGGIAIKLIRK